MLIESLRIKNFKSFRQAEMKNLPRFCVVVGANGSGKSTLFDVFGFLKDCLTFNVKQALQVRGGFREVLSRGVDDTESIELEIKFRMNIAGVERLVTYLIEIGLDNRQVVVRREVLRYKRGRYGSPYHFLDFTKAPATPLPTKKTSISRMRSLSESSKTLVKIRWPSRD